MKYFAIITFSFCTITINAYAGNLSNGQWQAANCGQKPSTPAINTKSVDGYNQSVKDINSWQAKAQEYYNCLVKEANTDNDTIAKAANSAQDEFRNDVSRIQKEAVAGKAKAEKN
jgi:hypothetical protein